jgi:hypothetical protein
MGGDGRFRHVLSLPQSGNTDQDPGFRGLPLDPVFNIGSQQKSKCPMFVGHYGPSFSAKAVKQSVPLWVFFLAVQLLDVLWSIFVLLGIEKVRIVPGITATNPLDLYYMPYTHSLDGALLWSVGAGIVYYFLRRKDGSTGASLVGGAVFSHWMLDVLVHRPDMPLYDNSAKIGLGLWNHPLFAFVLEVAVLFGGMYSYLRSTDAMLLVQAFVFFGPPPSSATGAAITALVFYFGFAGMAGWLEKERVLSLGQREKWLAK